MADGPPDVAETLEYHKGLYARDLARDNAGYAETLEFHKGLAAKDLENERATLAALAAAIAANVDREKSLHAAYDAQGLAVTNAYLEFTKAAIDRARAKAELVQKAAASIGTVYAAVLALSFAASGATGTKLLPPRGLAPAFFLAISIVLATAYVAYIEEMQKPGRDPSSALLSEMQRLRLISFINWVGTTITLNNYVMRVSVLCLGLGVFALPIAYVNVDDTWVLVGSAIALALALAISALPTIRRRKGSDSPRPVTKDGKASA